MLVTFHSKAWTSITMFGEAATELLKMMGHSGTVPSALLAEDIPAALDNLQQGLGVAVPSRQRVTEKDDEKPHIDLRTRAYPLIQMLRASAREGADVLWEEVRRAGRGGVP